MNARLLIDALVRQTTVLIAQVATTAGGRTPLANIANQVFLDLTAELERQGVGRKVIADMFGLALRSYQQKVTRLTESATDKGQSLWEALYHFLGEQRVATRGQVLQRFRRDDETSVRGILNDLVESGLVYRTGRGDSTVYRIADEDELRQALGGDAKATTELLAWMTIYRHGPVTLDKLSELLPAAEGLDEAVEGLVSSGRVTARQRDDETAYSSDRCLIPAGDPAGWEAALIDHYQAVVASIVAKLRNGVTRALPSDRLGGSTFSFDVWPGHPLEERVHGLLASSRAEVGQLWDEVTAINGEGKPKEASRVTFYFGQMVTPPNGHHDE